MSMRSCPDATSALSWHVKEFDVFSTRVLYFPAKFFQQITAPCGQRNNRQTGCVGPALCCSDVVMLVFLKRGPTPTRTRPTLPCLG